MNTVDQLIRDLIVSNRHATEEEQQRIVSHVANAPMSQRPVKINQWLRLELEARGIHIPSEKLPSVEIHLLKRVHFDGQWPPETRVAQFMADLHQAVRHPDAQIWTYRWLSESFAGFLAPSHVQNVPNPEAYIFVAYSADHHTIKTGFQASSVDAIFTDPFENLFRHR